MKTTLLFVLSLISFSTLQGQFTYNEIECKPIEIWPEGCDNCQGQQGEVYRGLFLINGADTLKLYEPFIITYYDTLVYIKDRSDRRLIFDVTTQFASMGDALDYIKDCLDIDTNSGDDKILSYGLVDNEGWPAYQIIEGSDTFKVNLPFDRYCTEYDKTLFGGTYAQLTCYTWNPAGENWDINNQEVDGSTVNELTMVYVQETTPTVPSGGHKRGDVWINPEAISSSYSDAIYIYRDTPSSGWTRVDKKLASVSSVLDSDELVMKFIQDGMHPANSPIEVTYLDKPSVLYDGAIINDTLRLYKTIKEGSGNWGKDSLLIDLSGFISVADYDSLYILNDTLYNHDVIGVDLEPYLNRWYSQPTIPPSTYVGDYWVQSSNGRIWVSSGGTYYQLTNTYYSQATEPVDDNAIGDIWTDTGDDQVYIFDGNSTWIPIGFDLDNDPTNELQDLSGIRDTLDLLGGASIWKYKSPDSLSIFVNGLKKVVVGDSIPQGDYTLTVRGDGAHIEGGLNVVDNLRLDGKHQFQIDSDKGSIGQVITPIGGDSVAWRDITTLVDTSHWQLNGTDLSMKNQSWNLGIGTTSPSAKLHVVGTTNFEDSHIWRSDLDDIHGTINQGELNSYVFENAALGDGTRSDMIYAPWSFNRQPNSTGAKINSLDVQFGKHFESNYFSNDNNPTLNKNTIEHYWYYVDSTGLLSTRPLFYAATKDGDYSYFYHAASEIQFKNQDRSVQGWKFDLDNNRATYFNNNDLLFYENGYQAIKQRNSSGTVTPMLGLLGDNHIHIGGSADGISLNDPVFVNAGGYGLTINTPQVDAVTTKFMMLNTNNEVVYRNGITDIINSNTLWSDQVTYIEDNNSGAVHITDSGELGLNTSTPTATLEILQSATTENEGLVIRSGSGGNKLYNSSITQSVIDSYTASGSGLGSLLLKNNGTHFGSFLSGSDYKFNVPITAGSGLINLFNFGDSARGFVIRGETTTGNIGNLHFGYRSTHGTEINVLSITGKDNRVGIVTGNPKEALHVDGNIRVNNYNGDGTEILTSDTLGNIVKSGINIDELSIKNIRQHDNMIIGAYGVDGFNWSRFVDSTNYWKSNNSSGQINDAVFSNENVSLGIGLPIDFDYGDNYIQVLDYTLDSIIQYTWNKYNYGSLVYDTSVYIGATETVPFGLKWFNDSTLLFTGQSSDKIHQLKTNGNRDIRGAILGTSSPTLQNVNPRGWCFYEDRLFVSWLNGSNDYVDEYKLTDYRDITTLTFVGTNDFSTYESGISAPAISNDGNTLYTTGYGVDKVFEYDLESKGTLSSGFTKVAELSISSQENAPRALKVDNNALVVLGSQVGNFVEYIFIAKDTFYLDNIIPVDTATTYIFSGEFSGNGSDQMGVALECFGDNDTSLDTLYLFQNTAISATWTRYDSIYSMPSGTEYVKVRFEIYDTTKVKDLRLFPVTDLTEVNNAIIALGDSIDVHRTDIDNHIANDLDIDPTNEYITNAAMNGNSLEITDGGGVNSVDLSQFLDNTDTQLTQEEVQDFAFATVNYPNYYDDAANELDFRITPLASATPTSNDVFIFENSSFAERKVTFSTLESLFADGTGTDNQTLSWSSPNLSISGGNSVDLTSLLDNTDSQTLSWSSTSQLLTISSGNSVDLTTGIQDVINENVDVTYDGLTHDGSDLRLNFSSLTQNATLGGSEWFVYQDDGGSNLRNITASQMKAYMADGTGTDSQTLSFSATPGELTISGGNTIDISELVYDQVGDMVTGIDGLQEIDGSNSLLVYVMELPDDGTPEGTEWLLAQDGTTQALTRIDVDDLLNDTNTPLATNDQTLTGDRIIDVGLDELSIDATGASYMLHIDGGQAVVNVGSSVDSPTDPGIFNVSGNIASQRIYLGGYGADAAIKLDGDQGSDDVLMSNSSGVAEWVEPPWLSWGILKSNTTSDYVLDDDPQTVNFTSGIDEGDVTISTGSDYFSVSETAYYELTLEFDLYQADSQFEIYIASTSGGTRVLDYYTYKAADLKPGMDFVSARISVSDIVQLSSSTTYEVYYDGNEDSSTNPNEIADIRLKITKK